MAGVYLQCRWRLLAVLLSAMVIGFKATPATAHSDAHFDAKASPHGGRMRMAGPLHLELVRADGRIVLYVTNHLEQPQSTAGGEAVVRFPEQGLRVELKPAGDNTFSASLAPGVSGESEAVVFVKLASGEGQSAHFDARPAAAAGPADTAHAHH